MVNKLKIRKISRISGERTTWSVAGSAGVSIAEDLALRAYDTLRTKENRRQRRIKR